MAELVHTHIKQDEYDAIEDGKIHYHVMKEDEIEVGDFLNFNIVGELNGIVSPTKELFRCTHKLTNEGCPQIKKGYAIVTLRRMVDAKK